MTTVDTAIIGAGPIGLEVAVALTRDRRSTVQFDKGQIGATIAWFPPRMEFFSSADRIAIAGVPIPLVDRAKCTREEYLAYLRGIVVQFGLSIRTYEEVRSVTRGSDGRFLLVSRSASGEHRWSAAHVVFATGDMAGPRRLGVPGEDLPNVSHYLGETHAYFRRRVLVVGGRNSAVEAALRCRHAGAEVTVSYRGSAFPAASVKYWLLPEIENRITRGDLVAHFDTDVVRIAPGRTTLRRLADRAVFDVDADDVLLMTGYVADVSLLRALGVRFRNDGDAPEYDENRMETGVPGVYVAGTAVAGTQSSFRVFIENCHVHAERIAAALAGRTSATKAAEYEEPES